MNFPIATLNRLARDFSRIPVYPVTPVNLQPKLTINAPGDRYEQEADRIADQVMQMQEPLLQQIDSCTGSQIPSRPREMQRDAGTRPHEKKSPGSSGLPLDQDARLFFEPRFGCDFSNVRVHTDKTAVESARALHADAFTVGPDIGFDARRYAPKTQEGKRLLAHELTHVVQQTRSGGEVQPGSASASLSNIHGRLIQRRLLAWGERGEELFFEEIVNRIIGPYYQLTVSGPQGEVSLRQVLSVPGGESLLSGARELINVLEQVIGGGETTEIRFVRGRSRAVRESRRLGRPRDEDLVCMGTQREETRSGIHTIDLDDIEALGFQRNLGERAGATAEAILVHEILEAYRMDAWGESFDQAHQQHALLAEARATGAEREELPSVDFGSDGRQLTIWTYRYPGGLRVDLIIHMVMHNVVEVRRGTRPYRVELRTFEHQRGDAHYTVTPVVENGRGQFFETRRR